jgi:hypothetical protein
VIAGTDAVAVDACAARTFWKESPLPRFLELAAERGLGVLDLPDSHQVHRILTLP